MRPAAWLEGRTCEHTPLLCFCAAVLDAFCHALQSPEAAAVFSPSLWVCVLLLIWGIAPGIELHRVRHRSQKLFCRRHSSLYPSPDLLLAAFPCLRAEGRHGKKKDVRICTRAPICAGACVRACVCMREERRRERGRGKRRGRARKGEQEREREKERESEREGGREGKREIER